jgi:hypothetical protein
VADETVECCHNNPGLIPPCAEEYYALLSPIQIYVGRNVKCLILTVFGVPRQIFVKNPNIAFGENPPSAGRANASGQTRGHDGHRRFLDINATAPKNGSGIPAGLLLLLIAWATVFRFFRRFYAFSTVLNMGNFADLNRCVVTKQVGEQEIDILHLRLVSIWFGAVRIGV